MIHKVLVVSVLEAFESGLINRSLGLINGVLHSIKIRDLTNWAYKPAGLIIRGLIKRSLLYSPFSDLLYMDMHCKLQLAHNRIDRYFGYVMLAETIKLYKLVRIMDEET